MVDMFPLTSQKTERFLVLCFLPVIASGKQTYCVGIVPFRWLAAILLDSSAWLVWRGVGIRTTTLYSNSDEEQNETWCGGMRQYSFTLRTMTQRLSINRFETVGYVCVF